LDQGEDNDYKKLVKSVTTDGTELSDTQIKEMAEKIANTQNMAQKKGTDLKAVGDLVGKAFGKVSEQVEKLSDKDKDTLKEHIDKVGDKLKESPEV